MKLSAKGRRRTVLLVDDDDAVLDVLHRTLSGEGFIALTAGNLRQAVEIADTHRLDIAIIDLKLPDGNGIDLVKMLKEKESKTRVIVLTGYGSRETVRQAMGMGADDFITKPFDVCDICRVVR